MRFVHDKFFFAVPCTGYLCVKSLADSQRDQSKYQVYFAGSPNQIKTCDQDCIVLMVDDYCEGSPKAPASKPPNKPLPPI